MTFRLFVDSSTGVDVNPEWDYKEKDEKLESRHTTADGSEFVYKWADITMFSMSVAFVNSSFKAQVNSWWAANTDLLWMEEGGTDVFSVHLTNSKKPIDAFVKPYDTLFQGKIELGSY